MCVRVRVCEQQEHVIERTVLHGTCALTHLCGQHSPPLQSEGPTFGRRPDKEITPGDKLQEPPSVLSCNILNAGTWAAKVQGPS